MTPIGHSMAGLTVYAGYCLWQRKPLSLPGLLGTVFLANSPDLDLIPSLLLGVSKGSSFHHAQTHTFAFAIIIGLVTASLFRVQKGIWSWPVLVLSFFIVSSHVITDYITMDTGHPYGEMLWWPISSRYYLGPSLFLDIYKGAFHVTFSMHNFKAMIHESLVYTPVLSWLIFQTSADRMNMREQVNS